MSSSLIVILFPSFDECQMKVLRTVLFGADFLQSVGQRTEANNVKCKLGRGDNEVERRNDRMSWHWQNDECLHHDECCHHKGIAKFLNGGELQGQCVVMAH